MGELLPVLLLLFWIFTAIGKKNNKNSLKKPASSARHVPQGKPSVTQPPVSIREEPSAILPDAPISETDLPESGSEEHSRLQPQVHVTPHDHSNMFAGSMEADREEYAREDMPSAVSETFFVEQNEPAVPSAVTPFLPPMNTGTLKQAFVLQEILTRPIERRR